MGDAAEMDETDAEASPVWLPSIVSLGGTQNHDLHVCGDGKGTASDIG
jgi:hypothetical protein